MCHEDEQKADVFKQAIAYRLAFVCVSLVREAAEDHPHTWDGLPPTQTQTLIAYQKN